MNDAAPQFTWSLALQNQLSNCPRAFYHQILGARQNTRAAILSHLLPLAEWGDNILISTLNESLDLFSQKRTPVSKDSLQQLAIQKLRSGWLENIQDAWKNPPHTTTNISELYYGDGENYGTCHKLPRDVTDELKARLLSTLETVALSPFLRELIQTNPALWQIPSPSDTVAVNGVPILAAPHFLFQDHDGKLCALTWDTGNEYRTALRVRLGSQAIYATQKLGKQLADMRFSSVILNDGARLRDYFVSQNDINSVTNQITNSTNAMRSKLTADCTPENYPQKPSELCQACPFRQLCASN